MFKVDKREANTMSIKELIVVFIPLTLNMDLHAGRSFSVDKYVFNKYMFKLMITFFHFDVFIVFEQIQDKNSAH